MNMNKYQQDPLLQSAIHLDGVNSEKDILDWVQKNLESNQYEVNLTPLTKLKGWKFLDDRKCYGHESGKFFQIQGLEVSLDRGGYVFRWSQPIINQPEVGILGFISKKIDGVLHVLAQAKMEPGNVNLIQISPTVQATRSNYTQAHGGRKPKYIEYFIDGGKKNILLDQLQSEQGARYLEKRNRNIIIQIPDDAFVEAQNDFIWMTLGQLQKLMRYPNLVHLDCRSILGSIAYGAQGFGLKDADYDFSSLALGSIINQDTNDLDHGLSKAIAWITEQKSFNQIEKKIVPLSQVPKWIVDDNEIYHQSGKFFSIVGVSVRATNREVAGWDQPLVFSKAGGIIGLLARVQNGILRFLIQALPEPGLIDLVELAATVQFTPENYSDTSEIAIPPFAQFFINPDQGSIRFDSVLSDEGGRFYHSMQRHLVVEIDEDLQIQIPKNYLWMTLREIQAFARFSNQVNIELRSMLSCVGLA
ncbi:NDP-hexose 2,3-dehydratase [Polynucleobacter paneuropaeus]|nr:NDP-hexose 2,3-dehydratase [Polynucleobacter paneuropaeus]